MDCGLFEGTSSPPLLESCLQEHKTPLNEVRIRPIEEKERLKPTFTSLFLRGLPTAVAQTWDRLDVTLADRRRVKHKLGGASEADRKSCRAHQNPCDSYQYPAGGGGENLTYCPAKCVSSNLKTIKVVFTCQCRVHRAGTVQVLHRNSWHSEEKTNLC